MYNQLPIFIYCLTERSGNQETVFHDVKEVTDLSSLPGSCLYPRGLFDCSEFVTNCYQGERTHL